jgi:hypothetical protein
MAELNQHPLVQHAGWMIGEELQTLFHFRVMKKCFIANHAHVFTFQGDTECLTHIHSIHLHSLYGLAYDSYPLT